MSLFERIQNKILIEQSTGSTGEQEKKQQRMKGSDYSDTSSETAKKKKTKYERLRDQRTKYNVFKNKEGVYKPSIASAKAKMGERLTNITKPPDPKATQKNALNASPARIKKLNKAQRRAARFEPGAGKERTIKLPGGGTEVKKFDKDYRTRILDRITKNQEGKIDTSKQGRINRMKAGISAKSPTIVSKVTGKRIPMPGGPNEVDFSTGGKGVNQKGIRTDQAVVNRMGGDGKPSKAEIAKARKQQAAYDKQVRANQAKLKTPGGAKYYTGKTTPLNKGVFGLGSGSDLQKVYDDLSSETGGRDTRKRAKNQPTKQQVQTTIDKKYPTKQGKDTRPARFVTGKDGIVRQYGGGKIPDKSTGAYGSANDRVAVSADKKTRVKAPNYDELTRKNKKIVKKMKNILKSKPSTSGLYDPFKTKIPVLPKTTPLVTPPKLDPITQPLTEPLKKTRTLKKIKIKAPPKTGTFKKIMKFAGKNRNPILKGLAYTAGGAYLLSRLGKTDNAPKNNKSLVGGPGNYITKVKPVTATFTLAGKGGDGYRPAGMKK
tara:strand:- start:963 stop:2600 length:1638 start_codon:yes stop_codon:yes gene_type:complete